MHDEISKAQEDVEKARRESAIFDSLKGYDAPDRVVHIKDVLEELRGKRKQGPMVHAPFPKLEELTGGFHSGQLVVISGPTGHGKTSLAKTLTKSFLEDGERSVWFSYEVPPQEFVDGFPGELNFYLPRELPTGRLDWIEHRIAESIAKYRTQIAFIDHLHFLVDLKALAASRNQSILIGILLRQIKQIALKYGIVIFLVAHIRKLDLEESAPTIDDLRDSSFVGQEADAVILIWRKSKPRTRKEIREQVPTEWTNEARIDLVKNRRNGSLGGFDVSYNYLTHEYTELDRGRASDDGGDFGA